MSRQLSAKEKNRVGIAILALKGAEFFIHDVHPGAAEPGKDYQSN
jgi:hypothetical protein